MGNDGLPTRFAPAERSGPERVRLEASGMASIDLLRAVLDASSCLTLVLNSQRQIVYANQAALKLFQVADSGAVLGRRPGEAMGCIHACEMEAGCGTSEACRYCGAALSMLEALSGGTDARECRMIREVNGRQEALDLAVASEPLQVNGERFVAVSMVDISGDKRRRTLEHIFFHDVLNTASSVQGLADMLARRLDGDARRIAGMLRSVSDQLVSEITAQRTLAAAENDELRPQPVPFTSLGLVKQEAERYRGFPLYSERSLEIDPCSADVPVVSDRVLLGRVLGNMLKNALEATPAGQAVSIGCRAENDEVEFWVRNPGVLSRPVQLQVFHRSFSTKGDGRGLGTYSMKLLTERYLGGSVSFVSGEGLGTEFRARYPRIWRA